MELSAAETAVLALLRGNPAVIDSLRAFLDAAATPEPEPMVELPPEPEPEPPPPPFVPPEPYERDGLNTIGAPSRVRYEWQGGADGAWSATRVPHWTPHEPIVIEKPHELTGRPIKVEYRYSEVTGGTRGRSISPLYETDPRWAVASINQMAEAALLNPVRGFSNIRQALQYVIHGPGAELLKIVEAAGMREGMGL